MPTNTRGSVARNYNKQMVHYLRKSVTFADNGTAVTVGVLPAGAVLLKPVSGVAVSEAFNAGTTNTLNLGTSDDADFFATLISLGTLGAFSALDESVSPVLTADTTITATVVLTGTAATTGQAEVVVAFIPDNDG